MFMELYSKKILRLKNYELNFIDVMVKYVHAWILLGQNLQPVTTISIPMNK